MDRIAFLLGEQCVYWSSLIFALSVIAAALVFLSLYLKQRSDMLAGFAAVPAALFLSLLFARLLHWYCFPEHYSGFLSAMSSYTSGGFALLGAFFGCALAVLLTYLAGLHRDPARMLDCVCLAGGVGITVGRLASFFSSADRGQLLNAASYLPWATPVVNAVSGATEYRLAVFLLQATVTGVITLILAARYLGDRSASHNHGQTALQFLLLYCAAQVVLDSMRYDSMYFTSNGFVSVVQVFSAVTLVLLFLFFSVRLVRNRGFMLRYIPLWIISVALLGCAGYMEYHVQRHGNQAIFAYSIMSLCLGLFVLLTLAMQSFSEPQFD